jgi:hypothetical protein
VPLRQVAASRRKTPELPIQFALREIIKAELQFKKMRSISVTIPSASCVAQGV